MKTSEKANMIMSTRLPRRYWHSVSMTEASKGVLKLMVNGEQPDTQASVFSLANFRIFRVHSYHARE